MKFYEFELNGETIKLRLTSNDVMTIEKKTGVSVIEYIQNFSMTTIIDMLMYMRRSSVPNFSQKDASELYDNLIDNGYTMTTIVTDLIMGGLVVSGFMSQEEMEKVIKK